MKKGVKPDLTKGSSRTTFSEIIVVANDVIGTELWLTAAKATIRLLENSSHSGRSITSARDNTQDIPILEITSGISNYRTDCCVARVNTGIRNTMEVGCNTGADKYLDKYLRPLAEGIALILWSVRHWRWSSMFQALPCGSTRLQSDCVPAWFGWRSLILRHTFASSSQQQWNP